jgi:hypothetical protein
VGKINATTEEMLEAMFSVRSVPRLYNEDKRVKLSCEPEVGVSCYQSN